MISIKILNVIYTVAGPTNHFKMGEKKINLAGDWI